MLTLDCHTIREIEHQPRMWMDTFRIIRERKADIERFLADNQITKQTRTVLTGAGTSAFVADTAACLFMQDGYGQTRSVATTDIVSAPCSFLSPEDKLFVSFARSGNSPESVAAYRIARKFCKDARHLIITCNPDGCLAKEAEPGKDLVIVLPDGTNDRSLAMTSSFTSMLIACLLCILVGLIYALVSMLPRFWIQERWQLVYLGLVTFCYGMYRFSELSVLVMLVSVSRYSLFSPRSLHEVSMVCYLVLPLLLARFFAWDRHGKPVYQWVSAALAADVLCLSLLQLTGLRDLLQCMSFC